MLALAALLEQAYRLALVVQEELPSEATVSWCVANELIDVLDNARVSLLNVDRPPKAADLDGRLAGVPATVRSLPRRCL